MPEKAISGNNILGNSILKNENQSIYQKLSLRKQRFTCVSLHVAFV